MTPSVSVLMGSTSDETVMKMAIETLRGLAVECEMRVLSAHRTPEALRDYVTEAGQRGVKVFICGAGGAAHLAGAVAAITTSPVIGVPLVSPNAIADSSTGASHSLKRYVPVSSLLSNADTVRRYVPA